MKKIKLQPFGSGMVSIGLPASARACPISKDEMAIVFYLMFDTCGKCCLALSEISRIQDELGFYLIYL